jgi:transcriptional regulator
MYVPRYFVEDRVEVLHAAIREAGLATLVTPGAGELGVSHIPLFLEPDPGPLGRLVGHVARANSQWKSTPDGSTALAIILGPNGYVSPSWYATKRETGRVVPTWDYVAVHAHGTVASSSSERPAATNRQANARSTGPARPRGRPPRRRPET